MGDNRRDRGSEGMKTGERDKGVISSMMALGGATPWVGVGWPDGYGYCRHQEYDGKIRARHYMIKRFQDAFCVFEILYRVK